MHERGFRMISTAILVGCGAITFGLGSASEADLAPAGLLIGFAVLIFGFVGFIMDFSRSRAESAVRDAPERLPHHGANTSPDREGVG